MDDLVGHIYSKSIFSRGLKILLTVNTFIVFATGLFSPFYALFIEKIGGGVIFAGISWSVFSIVSGVLVLVFSDWGLRVFHHRERLVALGYVIRGAVFVSYAFMTNLPQLIVTQLLWGIGAAVGAPAFDSLYTKNTDSERSLKQWSRYEGVTSIAVGLSALIGGLIIEELGFPVLFIIMAAICLLIGIYIWSLPKDAI
ncbi:MAG: MFS transporter [Patescibacteria group bacterium]|nr:MFS transporter [Patescibacteria group bacterium]MCL5224183.1 MFS transporter [Patescibacteria group bacterium]